MRRLSALCLRRSPRTSKTHIRRDPKETRESMADPRSSSGSTGGYEEANAMCIADGEENVILNPSFEDGLNNWSGRGCNILLHDSMGNGKILPLNGKVFASATERTQSWNGIQQEITGRVQRKLAYEVTAVVRTFGSTTSSDVRATLWVQSPNGREQYIGIANLQVADKEWVQLQGKFLLNGSPSKVVIYIEGPPSGTDILLNSLVVKHADKLAPSPPPDIERTREVMAERQSNLSTNIILNHDFSGGLHDWHPNSCYGYVISGACSFADGVTAKSGSSYAVTSNRTECWQGLEQDITGRVSPGRVYSVLAWVRVSGVLQGPTEVQATLKLEYIDSPTSYISAGRALVTKERWEKLEGIFSLVNTPNQVVFFLEGPPPGVDLLIDSIMISSSNLKQNERSREIMVEGQSNLSTNIILNHDFSGGLHEWHPNSCYGYVVSGACSSVNGVAAKSGSSYAVTSNRTECWQGLEQDITGRVSPGPVYSVLAWVRVSGVLQGPTKVQATLKLEYIDSPTSYISAGRTLVTKERWEKLEGFFSLVNMPNRVVFFLEGPPPGVDLFIDSTTISSSILKQNERTTETMVDPHNSLIENLISNHDFSGGLHSWHSNCCDAYVVSVESCADNVAPNSGRCYAVITNRTECWQGLEQDITRKVSPDSTYILEAYVRVSGPIQERAGVQATLRLEYPDSTTRYLFVGRALVSKERWERLEGSFSVTNMPRRVVFYLEGPSPGLDLLIDSVKVFSSSLNQFEKGANKMPVVNGDKNIIQNPHFEDGLKNWFGRGCKVLLHKSMGNGIVPLNGKVFASAIERSQTWNGIQQDITGRVQRKLAYSFNALVRTYGNATNADVRATLWVQFPNGREEYIGIANLLASDKEWQQLQGKFLLNATPSKAIIYLEGPPQGTDILVNSLEIKSTKKLLCLPPPDFENVLFGSNIIENSTLSRGLNGWYPLGSCSLNICTGSPQFLPSVARDTPWQEKPPSHYILATKRTETWMGPAQTITERLRLHLTYQVFAWVRVGAGASGPQNINVALGVDNQWLNGGQVEVNNDRWHEVAGSFRIEKQPSKVIVYVQGPSSGVDLMVAGLQIFPVDRKARFKYLKEQTDKVRRRDVVLKFSESRIGNLLGTSVKVRQVMNSFPFGSCINRSNIDNEEFVEFFVKNFNWAVFGNEMKWYHTEPQPKKFNYTDADEMLDFCNRHNMETRGHCIFWEVEDAVPSWVRSLHGSDLMTAVENHLTGLLSRYKGRFRHYDVNNEMLHGSFFQERLGREIRSFMFKRAHQLDPSATLFVNDYHVEDGCDAKSSPEMYIQQILDLQEQGAPVGGIGIQGHIDHPVGQVICSALDKLAILGLPIWFTELDVSAINEHVRADDLEVMLREAYAHPAVEGIMLWGFWEMFMCRDNSHLVDAEGDINEAGKRYLALKQEWLSNADGLIDDWGNFEFRGFNGTYTVEITTLSKKFSQTFVVDKGNSPLVLNINFP